MLTIFTEEPERYDKLNNATTTRAYGFVLQQYKIYNNLTSKVIREGEKDWKHAEDYSTALDYEKSYEYWKIFMTKYEGEEAKVNVELCQRLIEQIEPMIDYFTNHNKKEYRSMSLLTAVDHSNSLAVAKLIDIAYVTDFDEGVERDEGVLLGLMNIKKILNSCLE